MIVIPEAHKTEVSISDCGEYVIIAQPSLDVSSVVWIRIGDWNGVDDACRREIDLHIALKEESLGEPWGY